MARETALALGKRIREARKVRCDDMTLEKFGRQVAEVMGRPRSFSNVTISNWETGRQEPSWEALLAIVRLTHLPLEYFAGEGTLEDSPPEPAAGAATEQSDPRLVSLVAAVQRSSPQVQVLILDQLAALIASLRRAGR